MRKNSPSQEPVGSVSVPADSNGLKEGRDREANLFEIDFAEMLPERADRIDVMLASVETRVKMEAVTLSEKRNEQYWFVRGVILREMSKARYGRGKDGYKINLFSISTRLKKALLGEGKLGQYNGDVLGSTIDFDRFERRVGETPRAFDGRVYAELGEESKQMSRRNSMREELANAINNAWEDIVRELSK